MSYVRVNWADGSGGSTPVDAANLNNMDAYIATLDTTTAKLTGAAFTGNISTTGSLTATGNITAGSGFVVSGSSSLKLQSQQSGATNGVTFTTWNGSASLVPFGVGNAASGSALSYIDNSGTLFGNSMQITGRGGFGGSNPTITMLSQNLELWAGATGATALGAVFHTYNGTAGVIPFSVGGQFQSALAWVDSTGNYNGPVSGGIPTTRNGAALSVPVYTGTTSPVSPPTGSLWAKA